MCEMRFRRPVDERRKTYLALVSQVETQLRDAYAELQESGKISRSELADKLGVDRSVVTRRLNGKINMTLTTLADMVWALGQCIDVKIHPKNLRMDTNHSRHFDSEYGKIIEIHGADTTTDHRETETQVKFEPLMSVSTQ